MSQEHPSTGRPSTAPAALGGALLLGLLSACSGEENAGPANVLLISIDTLRADHLSCYGYERQTSPAIDRLAAEGVLCETAYSTTSWTLPAHHSMLSGLFISAHGICDERLWQVVGVPEGPSELPQRGAGLAEVLGSAGYETAGFYTWKYLEERFGFGAGFDTWERIARPVFEDPAYQALVAAGDSERLAELQRTQPERFDMNLPTAHMAVDRALDWLDEERAAPFFLFVHLFDVHDDYMPPAPFDTRFDPDYTGPIDGSRVTTADSPVRHDMPPRDLEHLIALYDGEIAWVDTQVERLLDGLAARGVDEDTLVVLTSDHGEEFFEHGHKTHRTHLFRESIEVPLIFRYPAELPAQRRVTGPVGIVDIAPTIAGLVGVSPPTGLSGTDLSEVLRGERGNEERTYLSELLVFPPGEWSPELQLGLHKGERHWILTAPAGGAARAVLFERTADALELGPGRAIETTDPELVRELERLRALVAAQRQRAPSRGGDALPLSAAEIAELASVGYTGLEDAGDAVLGDGQSLCLDGCIWP